MLSSSAGGEHHPSLFLSLLFSVCPSCPPDEGCLPQCQGKVAVRRLTQKHTSHTHRHVHTTRSCQMSDDSPHRGHDWQLRQLKGGNQRPLILCPLHPSPHLRHLSPSVSLLSVVILAPSYYPLLLLAHHHEENESDRGQKKEQQKTEMSEQWKKKEAAFGVRWKGIRWICSDPISGC